MAQKKEPDTVRLRNINSGAVVSVLAEKVSRLGAEWEPVAAQKATARKASSASDDK